MGLLVRRSICDTCSSNSKAGHQNLLSHGILHRDISIGNVLITEDESKGLLIDLDHAIRINRDQNSGETGSIGTKIFMSIGLLSQRDDQFRQHSFMDDLESMFWLLFWICVHYSGPDGSPVQSTYYEDWNFFSPMQLGTLKAGTVINPNFLSNAYKDFTDFYRPLAPCVDKLRSGVFPNGVCWQQEDRNLYKKMQDVLRAAMEDPSVIGDRPEPPRHHTRSKGSRGIMKGLP
jgi:serine/threonine protein kinase